MRAAITLLVWLVQPLAAQAGPAEEERAIALQQARVEGEEAERRGDHAACAAAYLRAFDIDSRVVGDELLYNAGICFELDGEVDGAVAAWRRLDTGFPRSRLRPRALVRAGHLLERVARFAEAADAYQAYGTLFAGEKDALEALVEAARFRLALGQHARAVRILELALRLVRPDRQLDAAGLHLMLSMARQESGDRRRALRSLATAAKLAGRRDSTLASAIAARIAALKAPPAPRPPAARLPERFDRRGRTGDILVNAPLAVPP